MAFVPYHGGFAPTPGISDPIQKLMEGYKASQMPAAMKRQAEMEELKKQLLGTQAKYAPQKAEQEINESMITSMLKKKQIEQAQQELAMNQNMTPSQRVSKFFTAAPDSFKLHLIGETLGYDSKAYKDAEKEFALMNEARGALTNQRNTQAESTAWRSLPAPAKNAVIGQAGGAGFDPLTAARGFVAGESPESLAQTHGIDINQTNPVYPLTAAQTGQMATRTATNAELRFFDETFAPVLAKHSRKIMGYSPKQTLDAIKGENIEDQAGVIAAQALGPEISALRLRAAGAPVGIQAIREMTDKSLLKLNLFQAAVSPEVYAKAQKKISDTISQGVEVYNDSLRQGSVTTGKPNYKNQESKVYTGEKTMNGPGYMSKKQFADYVRTLSREERIALKSRVGG